GDVGPRPLTARWWRSQTRPPDPLPAGGEGEPATRPCPVGQPYDCAGRQPALQLEAAGRPYEPAGGRVERTSEAPAPPSRRATPPREGGSAGDARLDAARSESGVERKSLHA